MVSLGKYQTYCTPRHLIPPLNAKFSLHTSDVVSQMIVSFSRVIFRFVSRKMIGKPSVFHEDCVEAELLPEVFFAFFSTMIVSRYVMNELSFARTWMMSSVVPSGNTSVFGFFFILVSSGKSHSYEKVTHFVPHVIVKFSLHVSVVVMQWIVEPLSETFVFFVWRRSSGKMSSFRFSTGLIFTVFVVFLVEEVFTFSTFSFSCLPMTDIWRRTSSQSPYSSITRRRIV